VKRLGVAIADSEASSPQQRLSIGALVINDELSTGTANDPTMSLIECLAYLDDMLSFYQDQVADESYLDVERERASSRYVSARDCGRRSASSPATIAPSSWWSERTRRTRGSASATVSTGDGLPAASRTSLPPIGAGPEIPGTSNCAVWTLTAHSRSSSSETQERVGRASTPGDLGWTKDPDPRATKSHRSTLRHPGGGCGSSFDSCMLDRAVSTDVANDSTRSRPAIASTLRDRDSSGATMRSACARQPSR